MSLLRPAPAPAPRPLSDRPLSPGFLFALLVAGGAAVAAVALGAWLWGRRRCRHKDTGKGAGSRAEGKWWRGATILWRLLPRVEEAGTAAA